MTLVRFMPPRGTASEANAYTGTLGELFVDTDNWQLRLSDGSTAGGHIQGGVTNLAGLTDVAVSGMTDGQQLVWSVSASKWVNGGGAASWSSITGLPTTVAGFGITDAVTTARTVATGTGLTGGGALSSNLTLSIANNALTNALLASMPALTIKGNNVGSAGNAADLTVAQVKSLLAIAPGDITGLAASATSDTTNASNISSGTLAAARLPAFTGAVTSPTGSSVNTLAAGAVALSNMANLTANSIMGNNTGSAATPLALSASQVKTLLAIQTSDLSNFSAGVLGVTGNAGLIAAGVQGSTVSSNAAYGVALLTAVDSVGNIQYNAGLLFNPYTTELTVAGTINGESTVNAVGGYGLNGKYALQDLNDGWLRVNSGSSYTYGMYMTGAIAASTGYTDGGYANWLKFAGASGQTYGTAALTGSVGGYIGLMLNDGVFGATFMSNGSTVGMYCQTAGYWSWYETGSNLLITHPPAMASYQGIPYYIAGGSNNVRITSSTSAPSGTPGNGDIWFQV